MNEREEEREGKHKAKRTAWKLQGTWVLIHWEVVQFQLALGVNGQPAETQYLGGVTQLL